MEKHIPLAAIPDSTVVWNLMMFSDALRRGESPVSLISFVQGLFTALDASQRPDMTLIQSYSAIQWSGYVLTRYYFQQVADFSEAQSRLVVDPDGTGFHRMVPVTASSS